MTQSHPSEVFEFQAEAKQLLHLMTHSLYSNREIFLRELISNASDACDKLRFEALDHPEYYESDAQARVRIDIDKKKKTLTITDNGIGMSRQEVIDNLGTIARSGTAKFLDQLSGDQKKDAALIGQFGVGFYSAFIVADEVEVYTRRVGLSADDGVHWRCKGEASYEIEPATLAERGTRVVLHLNKEAQSFLDEWTVRGLIKKYSDHITIPVEMKKIDGKDQDGGYEPVNSVQALWTRSRSEITDEEYQVFYKHIAHDYQEPLLWSHNSVEGKLTYTSLLYLPKHPLFELWQRDSAKGLKLYVRRTFILDDAEQFLPLYLRFVKGVVDSNDLPLNVSREILQDSPAVEKIKTALTKRVLDMLKKLSKNGAEYQSFWKSFGAVLKEGPVEDNANREKLAELLRFASTHDADAGEVVSLDLYLERMQPEQKKIYYLVGDTHAAVARSPLLESFRKKGIEVLLLSDRIDDWLMTYMTEYKDKAFQNIARGKLDEIEAAADKPAKPEAQDAVILRVADYLGDRAAEVRASQRLVDSPSCLVLNDYEMGAQMRKIMQAAGQEVPESAPTFELNLEHPLIRKLAAEQDAGRFADLVELVFDQAHLASGEDLADPVAFVNRVNKLLLAAN